MSRPLVVPLSLGVQSVELHSPTRVRHLDTLTHSTSHASLITSGCCEKLAAHFSNFTQIPHVLLLSLINESSCEAALSSWEAALKHEGDSVLHKDNLIVEIASKLYFLYLESYENV